MEPSSSLTGAGEFEGLRRSTGFELGDVNAGLLSREGERGGDLGVAGGMSSLRGRRVGLEGRGGMADDLGLLGAFS